MVMSLWERGHNTPVLTLAACFVTIALLLVSGAIPPTYLTGHKSKSPANLSNFVISSNATVEDGQTVAVSSPLPSNLTDQLTYSSSTGANRTYWIHLSTTAPLPNVSLTVQTLPVTQWGYPFQLPGGADSLPPLSMWTWRVMSNGTNDTSSWTVTNWEQMLSRTITWTNQTYEVIGSTSPVITVSVNPNATDGSTTPGVGFVMNYPGVTGAIPTNDPDYSQLAAGLHPQVVRFGTDIARVSAPWNTVTNQPKFNFTYFDQLVNFTHGLGAKILLSLPAGSWGDGNLLPNGMPLNLSVSITGPTGVGYFPADGAWKAWVEGLVNHTVATNATIAYWTIGNEFPTSNQTLVAGYTHIFNLAQAAIHAKLSGALVGSDVMMNLTYESYFATHARNVGFLSLHTYPGIGLCIVNGTYFPPPSPPHGSSEASIFSHHVYQFLGKTAEPAAGQGAWHNLTGVWLPVFNAETNLNGIGGNSATQSIGTDPRIQRLFGAAWVVSALIDGVHQNVSELTYFTLSSGENISGSITYPFGGWGFGLTAEGSNDADIRYAPYFALQMWSDSIPPDEPAVWTNSSSPNMVYAYAAHNGGDLSVVLVNRVNVPVNVDILPFSGSYKLSSVTTLDQKSYVEAYDSTEHTTMLQSAGFAVSHPLTASSVPIDGYGIAIACFDPIGVKGCTEGSSGGGGTGAATPTKADSAAPLYIIGAGGSIGAAIVMLRRFRGRSKAVRIEQVRALHASPGDSAAMWVGPFLHDSQRRHLFRLGDWSVNGPEILGPS